MESFNLDEREKKALKFADTEKGVTKKDLKKEVGGDKKLERLISLELIETFKPTPKARYPKYRTTRIGINAYKKTSSPEELTQVIISNFSSLEDSLKEFIKIFSTMTANLITEVSTLKSTMVTKSSTDKFSLTDSGLERIVKEEYDKLNAQLPALGGVIEIPILRENWMVYIISSIIMIGLIASISWRALGRPNYQMRIFVQ